MEELVKYRSNALRHALRQKEAELEAATSQLRRMREQRDVTASGYVVKRLMTLQTRSNGSPSTSPQPTMR